MLGKDTFFIGFAEVENVGFAWKRLGYVEKEPVQKSSRCGSVGH